MNNHNNIIIIYYNLKQLFLLYIFVIIEQIWLKIKLRNVILFLSQKYIKKKLNIKTKIVVN